MKKTLILLIMGLLIANCLAVNTNNFENEIRIEKTRADIIVDINGNGDYTSIQDAIDNATSGDTIYVWEGTYTENVVIDKTLSLIGNGSDDTIIDGGGTGNVVYTDSNSVNLSGFTVQNGGNGICLTHIGGSTIINCNVSNNIDDGIHFEWCGDNKIINCTISNNLINGISSSYESDGNTITGNTIVNSIYGIYLSDSDNNNITENNISNNNNDGVYLDWWAMGNEITQNNITNNRDYGIGINVDCEDNLIHHNNFTNNNGGGKQASDDGTNNQWDDGSEGNYWDDWLIPDYNEDGIVDFPYFLDGTSFARDCYPLTDVDSAPPQINNIQVTPNPQEIGGYVNISVNITSILQLDTIWINITGVGNFSMNYAGSNIYYYNTTYSTKGIYDFTISANDTNNKWSLVYSQFEIDCTPPEISNIQALDTEVYGSVNITCNITDNYQISEINITIDGTNHTMLNAGGDVYYYNSTYSTIGTYGYTIWAVDTSNNINSSSGTFEVVDITKPEINSISAVNTNVNENLNITVNITDNYQIAEVWINIDGVGNFSMQYDSDTGLYYYNAIYSTVGIYDYTIFVNDTSNNWNSTNGQFEIIETNPLLINFLGLPGWSWILLIFVIVIVIITAIILKKKGKEQPSEEESQTEESQQMDDLSEEKDLKTEDTEEIVDDLDE